MDDVAFWTAVGAAGAMGGAIGACAAAAVAWGQLRGVSRAAGSTALMAIYQIFDNPGNREFRALIYTQLQKIEPKGLKSDQWVPIERVATDMDLVGTMVKHKLIPSNLLYERYADVICPLWKAIGEHVQYRREQKGGISWKNFDWLAKDAAAWSQRVHGRTDFRRFQP